MLGRFTRVLLFATLWIVAHQAPLSTGICKAKKLEWIAMPFLQGIFPTQGSNLSLLHVLHCRHILYPLNHLGSSCCH